MTDFTRPLPITSPAGRVSPIINYRKDAKKGVKFTMMVVGELGTGKTTFVNSLLSKRVLSHRFELVSDRVRIAGEHTPLTYTSSKLVILPNTMAVSIQEFDADTADKEPGIALAKTHVDLVDDDNRKMMLDIIDAPGFGDNINNEICFDEIESYLRLQFESVLAEETRIKRNPRFEDTRVHVLLYFITPTGHGLREIDIQCMKRLSKYVNIIPVIGRADSFTASELKNFKQNVMIDIERFSIPVFRFDALVDEYDPENDQELIDECRYLAKLQPFAVVCSEEEFEVNDPVTGTVLRIWARQYPWGMVNINDTRYSDFAVLKSVILGSHLQDLKDLTHDFLYERYRTECLTKVAGGEFGRGDIDDNASFSLAQGRLESDAGSGHKVSTQPIPSMSNLKRLTQSPSMALPKQHAFGPATGGTAIEEEAEDEDETDRADRLDTSLSSIPLRNGGGTLYRGGSFDNDMTLTRDSLFMALEEESGIGSGTRGKLMDANFKRHSLGPQREQLRQISATVPYVLRHERIRERQQRLEEMEIASAKEIEERALLLEKRRAELKKKEKMLMALHQAAEESKRLGDLPDEIPQRLYDVESTSTMQSEGALET